MSGEAADRGQKIKETFGVLSRIITGVAVYVLLGPPIGGLTFMTGTFLIAFWSAREAQLFPLGEVIQHIALVFALAIPASYPVGVVPALLVACIAVPVQIKLRSSFIHVTVLGLLVGIGAVVYFGGGANRGVEGHVFNALILATCLVPTWVCWLVNGRWLGAISNRS